MGNPVSPIVVKLYMEDWKPQIIATAPDDCKPTKWKRCMDDAFCLVATCMKTKLQQRMNTVDPKVSIRITKDDEENNSMLFLYTKFTRMD